MAEILESSESSRRYYSCSTQQEEDRSYGEAPRPAGSEDTDNPTSDQPDSLVVGFGPIIPRWDCSGSGGCKLQYYVQTDTFPDSAKVKIASDNLRDAANSWNDLELGIEIVETNNQDASNFCLRYKVNPKRGEGSGTLAQAFFPHEEGQDVIVYSRAYDDEDIMKNVFQHELGHVLGLRHEFAIEKEGMGATQFMRTNKYSIMSYTFPPKIQDSDREQVAAFYKLPAGHMFGSAPVTDYSPKTRQRVD